jgi:diguanylate cyclase (GGDEF)-like protein
VRTGARDIVTKANSIDSAADTELGGRQKWRDQQIVAMLYGNARGAMSGSMINIALVSYVLSSIYPPVGLLVWFSCGQLLNIARWGVHTLYLKQPTRYETKTWLYLHRGFTFLSGSLYGVLAIFFFSSAEPLYQALVIFLVGGMGAAAVGTHGVDLITYRLFLFAGVIPLMTRSLMEQTEAHNALAFMLGLLAVIMLRAAKQTRDIMIENFDLSHSLKYRATHDGLVGLLNRDEFRNVFIDEVTTAPYSGETVSIIFIDLDNFKSLNDTCGHQAGDEALIEVGRIIRQSIRKSDIAARFGGDEFMILLRSDSVQDAIVVGEKILHTIQQFQQQLNQPGVNLGASVGIGFSARERIGFDELFETADRACYQAKNAGKGQVRVLEA